MFCLIRFTPSRQFFIFKFAKYSYLKFVAKALIFNMKIIPTLKKLTKLTCYENTCY